MTTGRPDSERFVPPRTPHEADAMVKAYWDVVYRVVYRLTRNTHDTDEITQETFLRAIASADRFRPGTDMRSWLLQIATNQFRDICRRKKVARAEPSDFEHTAATSNDPSAPAENSDLTRLLEHAIARLPDTARAVFVLRAQENLSFREIAAIVGIGEHTARWHMMQSRRKLIAELDGRL